MSVILVTSSGCFCRNFDVLSGRFGSRILFMIFFLSLSGMSMISLLFRMSSAAAGVPSCPVTAIKLSSCILLCNLMFLFICPVVVPVNII